MSLIDIKIKRNDAFTIVELLVSIVVVGIIAGIVIINYSNVVKKATEASLQADLISASGQLENFKINKSVYPEANNCVNTAADEICLKSSEGNALIYTSVSPFTEYSLIAQNGDIAYKVTDDTLPTLVGYEPININFEGGPSDLADWTYSGTWSPAAVTSTTDPDATALSGTYSLKAKAYYSQTIGCTEHDTHDTIIYKDIDLDSGNYTFSFVARNSLGSTSYDKTRINIINTSDTVTLKEWSTAGCGNGTLITGTGISFGALTSYSYTFDLASFKTIRFYIRAHNGGWQSHLLIDDISLVKN